MGDVDVIEYRCKVLVEKLRDVQRRHDATPWWAWWDRVFYRDMISFYQGGLQALNDTKRGIMTD